MALKEKPNNCAVHCDITQRLLDLYKCNEPEDRKLGVQFFEVINFLPNIVEDISKLSKRKEFKLPAAEPIEFEIYEVKTFSNKKYEDSLNGYKIYAIKTKHEPSKEYRLFFTIEHGLDVIVFLYLTSRPYDDWDQYDWEQFVINNLVNYYLHGKQNQSDIAGIWSWI